MLLEYTSVHPAYDTQIYELLPVWDMYCCWVLILYFSGCQNTLPFTLPTIHKSMSCYLSETCIAVEFWYYIFQVVRRHFRSPCLWYTNLWVVTCLRRVLL